MPTYIKTGYWDKKARAPKEWLDLDLLISQQAGGGGATSVTKIEFDALVLSNGLTPGAYYLIEGVDVPLYGGTTILIQAATTNTLALAGHGIFYNPIYLNSQATPNNGYGIWSNYITLTMSNIVGTFTSGQTVTADNSATATYLANGFLQWISGDWSLATSIDNGSGATADVTGGVSPSYAIGDDAIWGGKHWTNTSGAVGTADDKYTLSAADWTVVAFNDVNYNVVADVIHYDYEHDMIIRRKDKWNNDVDGNFQVFTEFESPDGSDFGNPIKDFQWGNGPEDFNTDDYNYIGVQSNYVKDSYFECINFNGASLYVNSLTNGSYIYNNIYDNDSYIQLSAINNARIRDNIFVNSNLSDNILNNYSSISDNTLTNTSNINNNILNIESSISFNILTSSNIDDNTVTSSNIYNNTLNSSSINSNTVNLSCGIGNNTLTYNSYINNNTLTNSSYIINNTLTNSSIDINTLTNSNIYNNTLTSSSYINNNTLTSSSEINTNTLTNSYIGSNSDNDTIGNTLNNYSFINSNILIDSYINGNKLIENDSINSNTLTSSRINKNTLNNGNSITENTLTVDSKIDNNILIYFSQINANILNGNSYISNNTVNDSAISDNTLSNTVIAGNILYSSVFYFLTSGTLTSKTIAYIEANFANATFDISAATIIYGSYSKQMFKNSAGTTRLGYYNGSDVFTVVNVNA